MKNKNGFTLIEIIVSILIASIGMMIATTLILNSMGFFDKTARSDNDKQILDGIRDYIQNELIYANEAQLSINKPDEQDWHCLYVKDGKLYRDNNYKTDDVDCIPVYGDDFYNNRNLKIDVRTFDQYRIDFKLELLDKKSSSDIVYKTSTTIELLNLKNNIANGAASIKNNTQSIDDISHYKIFYKTGDITPVEEPDDDVPEEEKGTVGQMMECKNDVNDKGVWQQYGAYSQGDFVEYPGGSGVWYRLSEHGTASSVSPPGTSGEWWKKIDYEYNDESTYTYGDIIFYKGRYYYMKLNGFSTTRLPPDDPQAWNYWDSGDSVDDLRLNFTHENLCSMGGKVEVLPTYTGTVGDELYCKAKNSNEGNNKGLYNGSATYHKGDFVSFSPSNESDTQKIDIYWYRLVKDSSTGISPNVNGYWKRITREWSSMSSYELNDVVYFEGEYYKLKDASVSDDKNPNQDIAHWEKTTPVIPDKPTCK